MSGRRLRVLSFTTVYPRPADPKFGLFVRARLQALAAYADVSVVSPVPVIDYGNPKGRFPDLSKIPASRADGPTQVLHPLWFYPPLAGWAHPWWLSAFSAGPVTRLRRTFPFDIIDAHFGHPEASAAHRLARRFGVPYTVTLRGNETFHAEDPRKRCRMAEALRNAARVIAVSEPLREFAIRLGVEPARTAVIPNGIDSMIYHPRDRAAERARLGMGSAERHILSAGYLIERKGHHRVIEALPELLGRGHNVRLWIVGDPGSEGDFAGEIRSRAAQHGLAGWVSFVAAVEPAELACYMSACDLFCLASSREGWPNVVNEALACGAPVVATDVGGVPAMVTEGVTGFVVPPGDPAALAGALDQALIRPWDREAISRQGLARDWDCVAREVYGQLSTASMENRQ